MRSFQYKRNKIRWLFIVLHIFHVIHFYIFPFAKETAFLHCRSVITNSSLQKFWLARRYFKLFRLIFVMPNTLHMSLFDRLGNKTLAILFSFPMLLQGSGQKSTENPMSSSYWKDVGHVARARPTICMFL